MNLSQLAYCYQPLLFLVTGIALIYGVLSYFTLPTREDPEITIREAVISTSYPGLPAEQVEEQITKPLEVSVRQVGEVERIYSTSRRGHSQIHVEIRDRFFRLDPIWDEVREQLETARSELPKGTGAPVLNDEFGDVAVVTAALMADDFSQAEQLEMAEHIRARLYGIEGTKRVELLGVQPRRIHLDLSEARMAALGLSPSEVAGQLQSRNVMPPAGVMETGGQRLALQVSGEHADIDSLRKTEIQLPDGGTIRLGDLGSVERGYAEPVKQSAYYNGKRAIVLAISMLGHHSVLDYGEAVKQRLDEIRRTLPAGYQLEVMTFQAEQVANAVYGVTSSVIQTLLIVLAVVMLFLGARTGLIVGSIIPAVMLVTLAVMGFLEMDLQRMSLATLIIALGLLVDNAIVIAEDFKTRLEAGTTRDDALRQTGRELAMPLLSSTLTTILVFLPLMLAEHVSGEYTRSISIVVAISLLTSWLLSLTLTPVLCHRFLKQPGAKPSSPTLSDRLFGFMAGRYDRLLRRVLDHRLLFLGLMGLALVAGIGLMQVVPKKFFPDSDRSQVLVYLDFPSDIASSQTDRRVQAISQALGEAESLKGDVTGIAAYAGFGGPRFVLSLTPVDPAPNKGFMVLDVTDRERVGAVIRETRWLLAQRFPDVSPQVTRMFLGPSDSSLLEVQVRGPDRDVLFDTAPKVEALLKSLSGSRDVRQSWEARIPTLEIRVDQAQARRSGVTSKDIARSLSGAIDGYHLGDYREGDEVIPIVLRYEKAARTSLQHLTSLTVYPEEGGGSGIPLSQVAEVAIGSGYSRIDRDQLARSITIEGRNARLTAEDMMARLQPELDELEQTLPPGHWIEYDGVVVQSAEGRAALQANLPLCLGGILILLVAQFNSIKRPLLIVFTIPLVIVGVAIGLLLLRANFGFMVLLGLYSLAGIIINNAIVLIDRIDIERQDPALSMTEAVIKASVRRLRPIVMSTVTTILGFLTLIVGHDPLFYGMASAMTFGLALGTLLSLGMVPVLYTYILARESGKLATGFQPQESTS